jgi:hypothetical protein
LRKNGFTKMAEEHEQLAPIERRQQEQDAGPPTEAGQ